MSVISRQPPVPPGSSNGATTMRSSPASARRGPLLAVCGLCGGAGASTLAYLTALAAARRGDAGGARRRHRRADRRDLPLRRRAGAAVADRGGRTRPRGPPDRAADCDHRRRPSRPGDRTHAHPTCSREGVELLLEHARERYALTVIDCGTLAREADQIALASATHVAWVLPATAGAASRGRQLLDAIAPHQSGREILVARHEPRDRRRALRELRDLARHRRALLILLPSVPELATGNADAALETAQVPLQAILGALGR